MTADTDGHDERHDGAFAPRFGTQRRGYDRGEVDEFVRYARAAMTKIAADNRDLRRGHAAAGDLARLHAELAVQRDELRRLRDACTAERAELDQLVATRETVQSELDAMAGALRNWLAEHEQQRRAVR